MFQLRPYQQDAVNAVLSHFRKSNDSAVIVLPTGAGKSLVIAEIARLARRKILVLTHVKELVEQNHQKFSQYSSSAGTKSGVYSAGLNLKQTTQQVTFASIQSVVRNLTEFANEYSLVVIDECHRVSDLTDNNQYGKLVQQLVAINPTLKVLGLTATPYRMGLGWIYQYHYHGIKRSEEQRPFVKCIYELPLSYMIKHKYLTPPKLIDAPVAQYDFSALTSNAQGDFNENEVNQLLVKYPRVTQAIVEQIVELAESRQGVMIFASTVKHAQEIVGYLSDSTALITGKTPVKARDELIQGFKQKQIKYLVNVSVLTTGFDAPHVDLIAILRPTESVSLYQQIVGRGLRLSDGKVDCMVIDYAGNGINIFYPEVGEKKPNGQSELVQVFCPACGFANSFWGIKDNSGQVIEHYGRKCQGYFEQETSAQVIKEECDYRFRFKECEYCNAQNDIAARECHSCRKAITDPDDKLKAALQLKNALVMRCAGMTMTAADNNSVIVCYHDEDGIEVTERFYFDNQKQQQLFNRQFGRRYRQGCEPVKIISAKDALAVATELTAPDFVVARKQKHYWQIQDKIFDYQGRYRKANELN
ncbi:MAG: DEAD/DEAH box helicase [Gammaproteobacteria bacterium]|nr:DEAD/DEAH box helicase [Gammaproteobacteria bacterium]